mmetsp:Transcript_172663/g.553366  ORF Transcript_172663/g.553366 Transcript_172663/m.553366 type:complete len:248 (+) Transcript_172663:2748-3491(+)
MRLCLGHPAPDSVHQHAETLQGLHGVGVRGPLHALQPVDAAPHETGLGFQAGSPQRGLGLLRGLHQPQGASLGKDREVWGQHLRQGNIGEEAGRREHGEAEAAGATHQTLVELPQKAWNRPLAALSPLRRERLGAWADLGFRSPSIQVQQRLRHCALCDQGLGLVDAGEEASFPSCGGGEPLEELEAADTHVPQHPAGPSETVLAAVTEKHSDGAPVALAAEAGHVRRRHVKIGTLKRQIQGLPPDR